MTLPQLSNPFSTGAGGTTFEQLVGTYYLVALLTEDIPRGLNQGITTSVRFQQSYTGTLLDDIRVVSETADRQRFKLDLQVKHDLVIGDNALFRRVLSDAWGTFTSVRGEQFAQGVDRLGIAVGEYDKEVDQHLQPVLDWARTSSSAKEFFEKLGKPGFASEGKRKFVTEIFRPLLVRNVKPDLTDDELFQFLRHLTILHFDIEHAGARDGLLAWNRLLDLFTTRDDAQARNLARSLFSLVAEYNKNAAGFDYTSLRLHLSDFAFRDRKSCQHDLHLLRRHTDYVLQGISSKIGGCLTLPRADTVSELLAVIKKEGTRHVVIVDESGFGKSVLLKLIADRLRQENEVIAIAASRLAGPSIESFTSMLQLKQPIETLLGAMSGGSLRCLLIDGLEKVCADEDRQRVLNDLLQEVHNYNAQVQQQGGHEEHYWRVVYTCRSHEWRQVFRETHLLLAAHERTLVPVKIGSLTHQELSEVVSSFPRLRSLCEHPSLRTLLLRPFYLDLVTRSENPLEVQELPLQVTEAWFLNWFWERVVRHPKKPDERENVLLTIAERQLQTHSIVVSSHDLNETAVRKLLSEDILQREEMEVRFTHDLYADWTKAKLIARQLDRFDTFHQQAKYYIDLIKPLRLRSLHYLEVKRDVKAWRNFVKEASQEGFPLAWRDTVIGAVFHSPLLNEIVDMAETELFDATSPLLMHLLRIMRTEQTIPNSNMQKVLNQVQTLSLQAQYTAYWREPDIFVWLPILKALIQHAQHIPGNALVELASACEMWVQTPHAPLRAEICSLCLQFLSKSQQREQEMSEGKSTPFYSSSHLEFAKAQEHFVLALFSGSDCSPNEIKQYIETDLTNERESMVKQHLLKERKNWIPVARSLPTFFLDVVTRILSHDPQCLEIPAFGPEEHPDAFFRRRLVRDALLFTGGTRNDDQWAAGAYDQGPFYVFLHIYPLHGLRLINTIINHATHWWRLCQEQDKLHTSTPLPQEVYLPDNRVIELWGDSSVYMWSSTGFCQSKAAICALRALEKWLYDQQDAEKDIANYLSSALSGSSSLALAHVLINVFLRKPNTCWPALAPLLKCTALWVLEPTRLHTRYFDPGWSFGDPFLERGLSSEARFQELQKLAGMTHFKEHLLTQFLNLLTSRSDEERSPLSALLTSLPEQVPIFSQEERHQTDLLDSRRNLLEELSAWVDPRTWQVVKIEQDEQTGQELVFWAPEKILARKQEEQREKEALEVPLRLLTLKNWGRTLRDTGEIGSAFTREDVIRQIEKRSELPQIAQEEGIAIGLCEAYAMILAGLLIHHLDWLTDQSRVEWATQQLLDLASLEDSDNVPQHPLTRNSLGIDRSIALALPSAIEYAERRKHPQRTTQGRSKHVKASPQKKRLHLRLKRLIDHPHYEVRGYVFHSLRALWLTQPDLVFDCFKHATRQVILSRKLDRPIPQNEWCRLSLLPPDAIDYYALIEVLELLPRGEDFGHCKYTAQIKEFINHLLLLTQTMSKMIKQRRSPASTNLHSCLILWDQPFGRFLGHLVLSLPRSILETFLLPSLVEHWLDLAHLSCAVLRTLVRAVGDTDQTHHQLYEHFIWLWRFFAHGILNSESVTNKATSPFETELLAMLLFSEPLALSDLHTRLPLDRLEDVFDSWVTKLGHTVHGFSTLVRFFLKNGRDYLTGQGTVWLLNSWEQLSSKQSLLRDSREVSRLSQLLHHIWYILPDSQKEPLDFTQRFARIVDECAAVGNPLAVELQRTVHAL